MGPGEIAPAEPPDPSAGNLPFQVEAGGIQTSKPMRESLAGVASPTIRHIGASTLVFSTVVPSASNSAESTFMLGAMVLPDSAWQRAASPWAGAAWPAGARLIRGKRAKTETNALRRAALDMNSPQQFGGCSIRPLGRSSRRRAVEIAFHQ